MNLYNVEPKTCEYCGNISDAQLNPMYSEETHDISDKYIYNHETSSLIPPATGGDNEAVVLIDGEWVIKPDYREKIYYSTDTQERHVIDEIGIEPDPLWTDIEPPVNSTWVDGAWVDDIELIRSLCLSSLSEKRRLVIDSGVMVDGIDLQSDDNSYANMGGYVSESIINGLIDVTWKCRSDDRHIYTIQELKPVFKAITGFRRECFIVEDTIATLIEGAEDPSSINIEDGWPSNILTTI